ncbi:uncharacterized protein METZ01_LOCUS161735, partial [marine metagenome]
VYPISGGSDYALPRQIVEEPKEATAID